MSEYDIEKSESFVGQLLPVIKDAQGRIVDGLHRKESNPDWREEVHENIKTDEDYWIHRAHLNYTRRNAHEARQEKIQIADSLAEYYVKQGLKVDFDVPNPERRGVRKRNQVLEAVIKALDGAIPASYIRSNINSKYTQNQRVRTEKAVYPPEKYKPTEQLKRDKRTVEIRYGEGFVNRLEKEIREKALEDPVFVAKAVTRLGTQRGTPKKTITIDGIVCQIVPEGIETGMGIDLKHETIYPSCLCGTCEHNKDCMGVR